LIIPVISRTSDYASLIEPTSLKLETAIQCPQVVGSTKLHLEDELATEHFKITTGIRLEKEMRESLINLHKESHGEISFTHFKRGLPHIYYKNRAIVINISIIEYAIFIFNLFFGIALTFAGLFLWFYLQIMKLHG
jgi:hypothetical protein